MTLIIENKYAKPYFVLYIKKRILRYMVRLLNPKKLSVYDEYFNSEPFNQLTRGVHISSQKVVMLSMMNLSHRRYEENTHIFINPYLLYPGTEIKLVDLCKVINYGNLLLEPYPIFSWTFNHFSQRIKQYLERFMRGIGV